MSKLLDYLKDKLSETKHNLHLISPKLVDEIDGREPDKDLVFVKWEVAHTLPMINRNGLGLSLISAESSIDTAVGKSANVDHRVIKNIPLGVDIPEDDFGNPISLHVGHIISASVEGPNEGQRLAIPTEPRAIFFTTALFRQEHFVQALIDDILDAHLIGRDSVYQASVEYGRAGSFEDDLIFDGEKLFSFDDAPEDLQEKFLFFDHKPIQHNGRVAGLVVGGNSGVIFSGLGILDSTVNPADVETRPLEVAASDACGSDASVKDSLGLFFQIILSLKGDSDMLNEKSLDFLSTIGLLDSESLPKAKAAIAILSNPKDNKPESAEYTEAVNNLSTILEKVSALDIEKEIDNKVSEALNSDEYIKADTLQSKIDDHISALKEKGEVFTKEDFDTKVQKRIDEINANADQVSDWLKKLADEGINVETLNKALSAAGQVKTVKDQLSSFAGQEDAEDKFAKSLGIFKLMSKGTETINSDLEGGVTPPVDNAIKVGASSKSIMDNFIA